MSLVISDRYSELKKELDAAKKLKYNVAVVSVPGMGSSRLLKKYARENSEVKYISSPGEDLADFSILDLAYDLHDDALSWTEDYFHKAGSGQSVAVAINTPFIFEQIDFKKSFFKGHLYKIIWIRAMVEVEVGEMILEMGEKVDKKQLEEIMIQSGGLPQLVKYELVGDKDQVSYVLEPILKVINKCSPVDLEKLGLMTGDKIISKLLVDNNKNSGLGFDIKIGFDLSIKENRDEGDIKVSLYEKKIIEKMLDNEGKITKEEVSDIKWGEGKYDEYSDQAINKAMRRLSEKLTKYKIETIPKVGYKLAKL
ncbi:helix-turn-helix domain-containing protein [Candidatus Shapirobacteria bacterium]|nr:helix-turn-helix domain-containing protein [Candidatus Shapirobacteria bacterium]